MYIYIHLYYIYEKRGLTHPGAAMLSFLAGGEFLHELRVGAMASFTFSIGPATKCIIYIYIYIHIRFPYPGASFP